MRTGRPRGSRTADPVLATAFGQAVRDARTSRGVAQEALAHLSQIERSHLGKVERGEHMPTIAIVLKIARALGLRSGELLEAAEAQLPESYWKRTD